MPNNDLAKAARDFQAALAMPPAVARDFDKALRRHVTAGILKALAELGYAGARGTDTRDVLDAINRAGVFDKILAAVDDFHVGKEHWKG